MRRVFLTQVVWGVVLVGGLAASSLVYADDEAQLKDQVKALQERVDQLEGQLANKQQASPPAVMPSVAVPVYDQWEDPFAQMMQMRQQMDRSLRQAFANTAAFNPRMDIKQLDKKYLITMDIPGMDRDKINVEVKEGMLIISGERRSESEDNKNNQYYRQERSFGSFMQAVPLPEDAITDQIDAKYKDGVLTVSVARKNKEEKKPNSGKITVN